MADDAPMAPQASGASAQAVQLRNQLSSGNLSVEELANTCLQSIARREPDVQAWAWLDSDHVLDQARALDARRRSGKPTGPLHGLPIGIKDIIDTLRIPTANGSQHDEGRLPTRDAWVVERLKAAGALLMGKTVTAELAYMHPGKTRNPHSPDYSPGGSSSGSAAAVAADMVPMAIGTQTGGSVIRPASYCGVVGYKPTFGAIPRTGILSQSPTLDTVGVFAHTVAAVAMLAEQLYGHDTDDAATSVQPFPRLLTTALSPPPVQPLLAFVRTPYWDQADVSTQAAFDELAGFLGDRCFEVSLPQAFDEADRLRSCINFAEMAKNYHRYYEREDAVISDTLREAIDIGCKTPARDYLAALDWPQVFNAGLDQIFERCDAILTPASPGAAPALDHGSTGSSVFNGMWTFCGSPCITLPLLSADNGLPMGVQLVGKRGDDARLLRTANWLVEHMASAV